MPQRDACGNLAEQDKLEDWLRERALRQHPLQAGGTTLSNIYRLTSPASGYLSTTL